MMPGSKDFFQKNNKRMSGYDPFGKENSRFVRKESACQVSRAFYLYLTRYIHDTVSDSQCRRQYDLIRQMLRIIQAVKQHFHCHFSHDFQMCGDTGQRWLGQDRQRCVKLMTDTSSGTRSPTSRRLLTAVIADSSL